MFFQPRLGLAYHGITVREAADEGCLGQVALVMPLQQVDLGDAPRLLRAGVARGDVQRQVVPQGRPAGGDDAALRIGLDEAGRRIE